MTKTLISLAIVATLAACGGNEGSDLDNALAITNANTGHNASAFQQSNYPGFSVSVQGDAAVSQSCLQGSGAGAATLTKGATTVFLSCPTYMAYACTVGPAPVTGTCSSQLHYPFQLL